MDTNDGLAGDTSDVPGRAIDAAWPMHDHGLALDRIPDVIANTVALIISQLQDQAKAKGSPT